MFFDATAPFDERETLRQFDRDLLPVLKREGPRIGEHAMAGDLAAENIIRRYGIFCAWKDPVNLAMLQNQLRTWLKLKAQ